MRFKSADKRITREEIKRFASEFDPQPYYLDETAAERRPSVVDRARLVTEC